MKVQPIIDRLSGLGFKYVGGLLEFAQLKDAPPANRLPAAYVIPEGWQANDKSPAVGVIDQKFADKFSVVLVLNESRSDARASEGLDEHQRKILEALVGWTHPEATSPCLAVSARLTSIGQGVVSWRIMFSTSHHLRKAI